MTSKLTRERIQRIIRAIDSEAYDEEEIREWLSSDEIMELSRIALAAMDSKPDRNPVLAYADSYRDMAKQGIESVPIWSVITDLERNIAPLYRHAQQPVVPVLTRADFENWCQKTFALSPSYFEKDANGVYMSTLVHDLYVAWEGCRAAMLSGSNGRKKIRVIVLGASIGAGFDATASGNSPAQSDCCPAQNHVSPEQNGDTPAQSQGWIPVSEKMPENEQEVLTINKMGHRFVSFFDKHSGLFFDRLDAPAACCIEHVLVTHWMPLPNPPKE